MGRLDIVKHTGKGLPFRVMAVEIVGIVKVLVLHTLGAFGLGP